MAGPAGAGARVGRGDVGEAATAAADFKDAQNELKSALSGVFLEIGVQENCPKLTKFIRFLVKKPEIIAFFTKIKEAAAPFFDAFKRA